MTIRKGEPWGSPVERPSDLVVVDSDAGIVRSYLDDPRSPIGLAGGDLHRSLGSPPERSAAQRLPIDLIELTVDGHEAVAAAHVLMRRTWWRGPVIAVMNVDRLGEWNAAPRAHPNDGRLDVITIDPAMSVRERWQARTRLVTGTHVPHPRIDVRTVTEQAWTFGRPLTVWVDGQRSRNATSVVVRVRPDAFAVLI